MIRIEIPQRGAIELEYAVIDVNGTLAVDGVLIPGVAKQLKELTALLSPHILTAGTHGNITELERSLGMPLQIINTSGDEGSRTTTESRLRTKS